MQNFVKNQESLTLKQMIDITAQTIHNEEEIYCLDKIVYQMNIFPGFTTLQLCGKISNLLSSLGQTPAIFTGRILFMSMFNDISCDRVNVFARRFGIGQWFFIGPGSEKKWYPSENSP